MHEIVYSCQCKRMSRFIAVYLNIYYTNNCIKASVSRLWTFYQRGECLFISFKWVWHLVKRIIFMWWTFFAFDAAHGNLLKCSNAWNAKTTHYYFGMKRRGYYFKVATVNSCYFASGKFVSSTSECSLWFLFNVLIKYCLRSTKLYLQLLKPHFHIWWDAIIQNALKWRFHY